MWAEATGGRLGWGWGSCEKSLRGRPDTAHPGTTWTSMLLPATGGPPLSFHSLPGMWTVLVLAWRYCCRRAPLSAQGLAHGKSPTSASVSVWGQRTRRWLLLSPLDRLFFSWPTFAGEGPVFSYASVERARHTVTMATFWKNISFLFVCSGS